MIRDFTHGILLTALYAAFLIAEEASFPRDIAPILATYCLECHGPDEEARAADLRLDVRSVATTPRESGHTAIMPGSSEQSEMLRRLLAKDDTRMPPEHTGKTLSVQEVQLLKAWIDDGARWQGHWAFEPLVEEAPPSVNSDRWTCNPIDRFVFSRLQRAGLSPAERAPRQAQIRRLYFDLVGLPPATHVTAAFVENQQADAYQRLVDELLASPRYGERWGRHWLDVARYGDSNGGDENHAYPLAYKYRNYVIDVFNDDLPYDTFVTQQLAGDLMEKSGDDRLDARQLTGTGYLAIGMKILAEQDPVKKLADTIDEQIDTFGRTFLGLSLGCARCHDHKFDPIPQKDYYALAGIFHSSAVEDKAIPSRSYAKRLAVQNRRVQRLRDLIKQAQSELDRQLSGAESHTREAESFQRGNVIVDEENYGKGIGIISDPQTQLNFAEYDIEVAEAGEFLIQLRYAAAKSRPGELLINGEVVKEKAIKEITGSWLPDTQTWFTEGTFALQAGINRVRIQSRPMMSHIDKLRLIPVGGVDLNKLNELNKIEKQLGKLESQKPQPQMVMAIGDKDVKNTRIHERGSHLSLGEEVSRGFLGILDSQQHTIPQQQSGRLQLSRWITQDPVASRLASRVIVNRVWQWHFGRGMVSTPDDFGIRGVPPVHNRLLDYLAGYLIRQQWSLKSLTRLIVSSETYRMDSVCRNPQAVAVDPANLFWWKRNQQRLDAESIRDAMLYHTGQLSLDAGGGKMDVKSQDPSPEDMQNNLTKYENSRRRSVYLPVVRSNVFEFFTLFDFPNASTPVGKRNQTTIPTQAMWMLNSPFMNKHVQLLARQYGTSPDKETVKDLYLRLYARPVTSPELRKAMKFLSDFRSTSREQPEAKALAAYCQVLLSSNEFFYLR